MKIGIFCQTQGSKFEFDAGIGKIGSFRSGANQDGINYTLKIAGSNNSKRNKMRKILVIDDEPEIIKTIKKYLEMGNYQVFTALDGQKGIEAFLEERPHLVITDLRMPGMGGKEVLKALKDIDEDIQVIIVTGHSSIEDAIELIKYGAADFLLKPVDIEHLKMTVERSLKIHQLNKKIKKTDMFKRAIVDAATGFYICTCDLGGNIISWNKGAELITGYSKKEVIGKIHFTDMLAENTQESNLINRVVDILFQGKIYEGEIDFRKKNSSFFPALFTVSKLEDDNDNLIGMLVIVQDITEKKLAQDALKAAMDKAQAANQAKSEFLANMSHEIRTPMNGVIGMTALLLDTDLDKSQRDLAVTVKNSAESLLTIINDILDFSRIEAGKLEIEYIDFDLQAMLEELVDSVAFKAAKKGLDLVAYIHPEIETQVAGDPGRIRQIIINLANNAIKFTSRGQVIIKGELDHETKETIQVKFSISDTGIGIPEKILPMLFESFTQADSSTTRKYGGTGLGLAISKQLAELMYGNIGVKSEKGKGSTFWFTVPLKKRKANKKRNRQDSVDLTGKKILIADNIQTNRDIMRLQMKHWGCIIAEAHNGDEALLILKEHANKKMPFDIAIFDMQMPGMNEEELLMTIRDDPVIKKIILVMLTSVGLRGDAKRMKEFGFFAYLTKPMKQSQLFDCLVTSLGYLDSDLPETQKPLITRHTIAEAHQHNKKILIVEDNLVNQKVATKLIEKMGYQTTCAVNGKEAVKAVQTLPYDIILMDCQMPVMDGFEATQAIRHLEAERKIVNNINAKIPIIAMTANAMKGDRERCIEAGMDDYLSKPVKPGNLSEMIGKWLK